MYDDDYDPDYVHPPALVKGWGIRDAETNWVPPESGADRFLYIAEFEGEEANYAIGPVGASCGLLVIVGSGELETICDLLSPDPRYLKWLADNNIPFDPRHPFGTRSN